ncbi:MAG: HEAT repeat domain-containing protein [Candidatus Xenobia bacterium]
MNARAAELKAHLSVDAYDAIIDVGQEWLKELKDEVVPYLDSEDEQLRSAAIRVLGFYWTLPEFRDKAWEMFRSDPDLDVRQVALMSWGAYYNESHDPHVLRLLGQIFSDPNEDPGTRGGAYMSAQYVAGVPGPDKRDVSDDPDGLIDWAWAERTCGVKRVQK